MGNAKRTARKALAVFSAAALLLSCGATGYVTTIMPAGIEANAASNVATQLKILDENGKELGDNAILYVDNSDAAAGITDRTIKVVASNDSGVAVNDEIRCFADGDASKHIYLTAPAASQQTLTATVSGGYNKSDSNGKVTWVALKPGTSHLSFTTASGEVYRSITVVTYQPGTDMKVYNIANGKKSQLELNDNNESNSVGMMAIANHQYQFAADKMPSDCTDDVEWFVYEGGTYEGQSGVTPSATKKAEISPNGLFTPKSNGEVTVMVKYKATETSSRSGAIGDKKLTYIDENGKPKTETFKVKTVPKYIHVTIVKENPAKDLKITNNPGALEVDDTLQLKYKATPTYTGAGYESGATDSFRWESSNPKVITVDEKGLIKAVGKGEAKIIVYGENENVRAEANIKVLTKATSIRFQTQTVSTRVDAETTVKAIMSPTDADEEIRWTSSDPSIATVESLVTGAFSNEQTAVIKGIKKGTVTITATAVNSGVQANITCTVNEKKVSANIKLSTSEGTTITEIYEGSTISVYDQKPITVNGALLSADNSGSDDEIVWDVLDNGENNGDYVTINEKTSTSIKLTGFARGIVRVKASSKANPALSKTFYLEILKKATKGSILEAKTQSTSFPKHMNVGSTISLTADLVIETNNPHDHDDYVVDWVSSNKGAFKVDSTGYVTAVGNGTAKITMITKSNYSLSVQLTAFTTSAIVINGITPGEAGELPSTSVVLSKEMTATKKFTATVRNEKDTTVSGPAITWSTDNEDIATIDEKGTLTAKKIGEVIVTAKSGNKTDSCRVNIDYSLGNSKIEIGSVAYSPFVTEYKPAVTISYTYEFTDILGMTHSEVVNLVEGKDYTLAYSNNTKVGATGNIVITGLGHYAGTVVKKTFKIVARPLSDPEITITPIEDQELTAANKADGVKPEIVIDHGGYPLVEGTDYTVSWANNKKTTTDAVKATATITGKSGGNYTGKIVASFNIFCRHEKTTEKVTKPATCKETGIATSECTVCGYKTEKTLPLSDHSYKKSKVVEPTYTEGGYTLYTCSVCKAEKKDNFTPALSRVKITSCSIVLDKTTFTENGKVQTPKVTVKYGTKTLKENTDYTLSYSNKSSSKPGSYTVKVVGMGGYTGTSTKSYKIIPNVKSIKLDRSSTAIGVGESIKLKATTDPSSGASYVQWTTSNSSVATVSGGTVTGKKTGTATITATVGSVKATCTVTVKNAPSSVSLTKTSLVLGVGETYSLGSSIPANSAAATRTYSSSNSSVIKMTKTNWTGEFKAMKTGTAKVTVKLYNGKTASCTITVKNAPSKVTITKGMLTLGVGEKYTLGCGIPTGTGAAKRTFRSSNSSVVKMNRTDWQGDIEAMKVGTAYVTVRLYNGKEATCKVIVKAAPKSVKLNKGNMTLKVGKTASVSAVLPDNTGAAKRTYRSSNSSVVKMTKTDWTGEFKAMKPGTSYVTVRLYNGTEASIKVTVTK